MKCPYCKEPICKNLTFKEMFCFHKLAKPSLCLNCLKLFKKLPLTPVCYGCNRLSKQKYCSDCLKWQKYYPEYNFHHEALFEYNQAMHEWFEQFKFRGDLLLSSSFSKEINRYFKNKKDSIIIPLPVTEERFEKRGFNQVEELLKAASVPYFNYLLRVKESQPQSQKNRRERLQLSQPFSLAEEAKTMLEGKTVFLVDDIYTTGRTLFHAAQIILAEPAAHVYTFSLAR